MRSLKSKHCISDDFFRDCFASGSQLPKVRKPDCPMRPIVAAYGTYNFNLGKHILPMISQLAINQYTIRILMSLQIALNR